MEYFKVLSLILGGYIFLASLWITLAPNQYRVLGERFIPATRPLWFLFISILFGGLILYTWGRFLGVQSPLTLAVTLVFSLTLIKLFFVCFAYGAFRNYAEKFLRMPDSILRTFGFLMAAVGICLLAIGLSL